MMMADLLSTGHRSLTGKARCNRCGADTHATVYLALDVDLSVTHWRDSAVGFLLQELNRAVRGKLAPHHVEGCDLGHVVFVGDVDVVKLPKPGAYRVGPRGFWVACCGCAPTRRRLDPGEARKRRRLLVGARPVKTRRPPVTPSRHVTVQVEPGPWLPWPYAGEATPQAAREFADWLAAQQERQQPTPHAGGTS